MRLLAGRAELAFGAFGRHVDVLDVALDLDLLLGGAFLESSIEVLAQAVDRVGAILVGLGHLALLEVGRRGQVHVDVGEFLLFLRAGLGGRRFFALVAAGEGHGQGERRGEDGGEEGSGLGTRHH